MLKDDVVAILGEGGTFATDIDNFTARDTQVEFAKAVAEAIDTNESLIAESGTGTGKTYAYLVPALLASELSGKKTLISTGTKHLQEQLFHRDLPVVLKTLAINAKVALLKGRANYLCIERLSHTKASARRLSESQLTELQEIAEWRLTTRTGDIAEVASVPEDSRLWSMVTSTVDNCLGQGCDHFDDCYVNEARKKALKSEVVIINHHLYFADKSLKEDGFGALLPTVDTVIFDEAHQIPDIATNFLGNSFSSWQVNELVADVKLAEAREKSLLPALMPTANELEKLVSDTRLSLGLSERRIAWYELIDELPVFGNKLEKLATKIEELSSLLEKAVARGESLARCYERAKELEAICRLLSAPEDKDDNIRWLDIARRSFRIHETPLHIGNALSDFFSDKQQSRIFTSATLSIDGSFNHFQSLMGLPDSVESCRWDSPFDFYNQAVLYVPEGMPAPADDGFAQAMFDAVLPLIEASHGHAFLLFTSFKIMQLVYEQLQKHDSFNVLVQGETNKTDLLNAFMQTDNSVLLGTMSFWEGVDVAGDQLRLVVIDKLPFESPYDPVVKARLAAMQDAGENPFMQYQVPRAVITLRQGAGRLIRSQRDQGVLMLCDSRLRGTRYGKIFLNSLPAMRRTTDGSKVAGYLRKLHNESKDD